MNEERGMVLAYYYTRRVVFTKVSGKMTRDRDEASKYSEMVRSTSANTKIIKRMGKASTLGPMVKYMTGSSKEVSSMAMGIGADVMEIHTLVSSGMVTWKGTVFTSGSTGTAMKVNGATH